jgi:hypothetical protein
LLGSLCKGLSLNQDIAMRLFIFHEGRIGHGVM